jgi:predicted negative regulator of RcsB-dependent stress response
VEEAILKIDQAAVALLLALEQHKQELKSCVAAQDLARVQAEVVNLRRAMLGLEMGVLYQDWEGTAGESKGEASDICSDIASHE